MAHIANIVLICGFIVGFLVGNWWGSRKANKEVK